MQALLYATQLLGILPGLLDAGKDVADLIKSGNAALKRMQEDNRDPTKEEWDELNAEIRKLQEELHS
jgi:gas vesicle protein